MATTTETRKEPASAPADTRSTTAARATARQERSDNGGRHVDGWPGHAIRTAGGAVAGAVTGTAVVVRDQAPRAVEIGGQLVDQAGHAMARATDRLQSESEARLSAAATFTFGLSLGLLVGGAPRPIVGLVLVPAVAMGLAVIDRRPLFGPTSGA
jgi:hypothetical protein